VQLTSEVSWKEKSVHRDHQQIGEISSGGVQRENDRAPSLIKTLFDEGQITLARRSKDRYTEQPFRCREDLVDQVQRNEEPKDRACVGRDQPTPKRGHLEREDGGDDESLYPCVAEIVHDGPQARVAVLICSVKLVREDSAQTCCCRPDRHTDRKGRCDRAKRPVSDREQSEERWVDVGGETVDTHAEPFALLDAERRRGIAKRQTELEERQGRAGCTCDGRSEHLCAKRRRADDCPHAPSTDGCGGIDAA
jgi:hypothetical protein